MRTAEAITTLREKIGSQRSLAQKLGVTITSVSRYENGRQPTRKVLRTLAEIADTAGLGHLGEIFQAEYRASVVGRIESLRSTGTERPVPLDDLKRWSSDLQNLQLSIRDMQRAVREGNPQLFNAAYHNASVIGDVVRGDIDIYIGKEGNNEEEQQRRRTTKTPR